MSQPILIHVIVRCCDSFLKPEPLGQGFISRPVTKQQLRLLLLTGAYTEYVEPEIGFTASAGARRGSPDLGRPLLDDLSMEKQELTSVYIYFLPFY